jgi:hypothetical protein
VPQQCYRSQRCCQPAVLSRCSSRLVAWSSLSNIRSSHSTVQLHSCYTHFTLRSGHH